MDHLFLNSQEGAEISDLDMMITPMTFKVSELAGVSVENNGYEVLVTKNSNGFD